MPACNNVDGIDMVGVSVYTISIMNRTTIILILSGRIDVDGLLREGYSDDCMLAYIVG